MIETIEGCGERPLRFLRYFILSQYDVDTDHRLTENDIYQWFRLNQPKHGIENAPLQFLDKLLDYSEVYANFVNQKDHHGNDNSFIYSISRQTTSSARQHFILLMAGRNLNETNFNLLAENLENLLLCYYITRQRTNVLERSIVQFARDIRNVRDKDDLIKFLEKTIHENLKSLLRDFDTGMLSLTTDSLPKYRLRYILAKIVSHIERSAGQTSPDLANLLSRNVEIEHILSQRPTDALRDSFDESADYDEYVKKLGNLTLLEKTINTSVSNGTFDEKKPGYEHSQYLLTSSLAKKPIVGNKTQFK